MQLCGQLLNDLLVLYAYGRALGMAVYLLALTPCWVLASLTMA